MSINANVIIYGYLVVCLILMLFNFIYMFRSNGRKQNLINRTERWRLEIWFEGIALKTGKIGDPAHRRRIARKLTTTNALIPYVRALEALQKNNPDELRRYVRAYSTELTGLAYHYKHKDSMDRAFFADIIHRFFPCCGEKHTPVMDILLSYLEHSTIYCRENVLNALYALGNTQAVENAFEVLNARNLFHHPKLLSDGLASFSGDKEELAAMLWAHNEEWPQYFALAVVQFITSCSANYRDTFICPMTSAKTNLECRLAMMRYYRRYPYEPVRRYLLECLDGHFGDSMAIVATSVLEKYPGDDTVCALKKALSHHNWYVRYNAAAAIDNLRVPEEELRDIFEGTDRYAKEILRLHGFGSKKRLNP